MITLHVRSPYVQVTTSHAHPTVTLPCMVTLPRMVTVPLIGLIISGEDEDDYDDDGLITFCLSVHVHHHYLITPSLASTFLSKYANSQAWKLSLSQ